MNSLLREIILKLAVPLCDLLLAPLILLAAALLRSIGRVGITRVPVSKLILRWMGVFPIIDHYHEPRFDHRQLMRPLRDERDLPGIDWNIEEQLALLEKFEFGDELESFPREGRASGEFYYNNGNFGAGDAEYFCSIIRLFKPARLIEIGAGFSTLIARNAIAGNAAEQAG